MVLSVACGNALLYVFTSLLHLSANMVPIRFGSIDIEVRSAHAGANNTRVTVNCARTGLARPKMGASKKFGTITGSYRAPHSITGTSLELSS